ncbi:hypothetical protein Tco_0641523, partial [Tanacetum coccineum]
CKGSVSGFTSEEVLPLFFVRDWYLNLADWVSSTWYLAPFHERSTTVGCIGFISMGGMFPPESLSPSDPSGRGVVLAKPSSEVVEGNHVSIGYLFPTESLGSIVVLSGKGTMPEKTEWDCSEPSVGLGGVTLVSVGGFLDLGFCLFLKSAPEASGPCDWGKVEVIV